MQPAQDGAPAPANRPWSRRAAILSAATPSTGTRIPRRRRGAAVRGMANLPGAEAM